MHGIITGTTYIKKEKYSDRLRMNGGCWTISLKDIAGKMIDKVIYITAEKTYSIDFKTAVKKGFFKPFQGEPKLCVPLKEWTTEGGL